MAGTAEVPGPIWLITGVPGSGKSTLARAICTRYSEAVHIPVDDLRDLVVSGFASPLDEWSDATARQFAIARRAAARMAADYSDASFAVVLDDVVREDAMDQYLPYLGARPVRKVAVLPRLDVALARNRSRTNKRFDPSLLEPVIRRLHGTLREGCRPEDGWTTLDTSELSGEEATEELFRQITQA